MTKLIVGLGNPGKRYERTRHNAGFLVVDALLQSERNSLKRGNGPYRINRVPFCQGHAMIAKPDLYMNESGQAVRKILDQFQISADQCLVVVDDVNLPVGKIRFRAGGSAGGHHGLESVIKSIGTSEFPRLRIGVGLPDSDVRDLTGHVLGPFSDAEWKLLGAEIERARAACLEWVRGDAQTVMQLYN